jgi:hypothetical protein
MAAVVTPPAVLHRRTSIGATDEGAIDRWTNEGGAPAKREFTTVENASPSCGMHLSHTLIASRSHSSEALPKLLNYIAKQLVSYRP